jgi:hypothetical protein
VVLKAQGQLYLTFDRLINAVSGDSAVVYQRNVTEYITEAVLNILDREVGTYVSTDFTELRN